MRLTNHMRNTLVNRLVDSCRAPRAARLRGAEHALAVRMLRHRYGADVFERCRALPDGWLHVVKTLRLDTELWNQMPACVRERAYRQRMRDPEFYIWRGLTTVQLSEYAPLPVSAPSGWDLAVLGKRLYDDLHDHASALRALEEEMETIATQARAVAASFTTVERLCADWPEGYAHLPAELLAPVGVVPAIRIEDLNARVAAAREAA